MQLIAGRPDSATDMLIKIYVLASCHIVAMSLYNITQRYHR